MLFGLSRRGVLPGLLDFGFFLNSCSSGPFFWNEIFVLGVSAVSSFFFKALPEPGFCFGNEVILVFFGLSRRGGCFSQDLDFFDFFGIPAVLGPFFVGMKFVFLDFLQFRAFFSKPYQNQVFLE